MRDALWGWFTRKPRVHGVDFQECCTQAAHAAVLVAMHERAAACEGDCGCRHHCGASMMRTSLLAWHPLSSHAAAQCSRAAVACAAAPDDSERYSIGAGMCVRVMQGV